MQLPTTRLVLQSLTEHQVDGLLLIPAIGTDPEDVERIVSAGTPVVVLNRSLDAIDLPYMGPDEHAIGELAFDHLAEVHGVESIAYFGGPAAATPRLIRERTIISRASELGVSVIADWCTPSGASAQDGYAAASALLADGAPPAGLICHSDGIALGVLRALHDSGVAAGRCRLIGIDNVPDAAYWNPSLASVGRAGGDRLGRRYGATCGAGEHRRRRNGNAASTTSVGGPRIMRVRLVAGDTDLAADSTETGRSPARTAGRTLKPLRS